MTKHKITAVLGPTNTGKTHLAIETMLSFDSGMIGFPLRLLAREVYDKITQKISLEKVALITGEEKIAAEKYVPSAWMQLLKTEPAFILKTHLDRNAYLVPIPISGIPAEPFLHSIIEYKDQGIDRIRAQ